MRRVPAKLLIHVAANAKHVPDMVAQLIQSGTVPVADFLNPQVLLYADEEAYSTIIAIEARSTRLRVWHFAQTH